jgi:predicted nucleic acid-binding Zn ribbon protein
VTRPPGELEPLGALVPRVLRDLGLDGAGLLRVAERWERAVGAEIAAHCRPAALRGATLELAVDSSVWAQQLKLREPEILAALRASLGEAAPAALRFRIR